MDYNNFLLSKKINNYNYGFDIEYDKLNHILFDFQKDLVKWSIKKGKSAIFAMTGLGKTFMQCEFAKHIANEKNIKSLIVAPLAVSRQTIKEAQKLNIDIFDLRNNYNLSDKINIINYEQLNNIDTKQFNCVILDESSILKNYSGKIKNEIIEKFKHCDYKLACSATPAPNDHMELGNHSEFLDIMTRTEMLSNFFIHDSGETQKWRIKKHAIDQFWEWVASWGAILTKPSDLGYGDELFKLHKLNIINKTVKTDNIKEGFLFKTEAKTLNERREARKRSTKDRVKMASKIINNSNECFLVWCNLNVESDLLKKNIKDSVEVKGSDDIKHKEKAMIDFSENKIKVLITKPKIAGFGMNWQHCNNIVFVGLSDSFEQYFQAVRRCWRFGQKKEVNVYIITCDEEGEVVRNIKRKEKQAEEMFGYMVEHTKKFVVENIKYNNKSEIEYKNKKNIILPNFLQEVS